MSTVTERALCPECGGPVRSARCAVCGHVVEGLPTGAGDRTPRRGAGVEAAWILAARATLAFLAFQVLLRAAVMAQRSGSTGLHLATAALGAGVILAIHRALTRRNETVLRVWMGLVSFGTLALIAGTGLWWMFGAPGVVSLSLSLTAAALMAGYAWVLYRVTRTLDG